MIKYLKVTLIGLISVANVWATETVVNKIGLIAPHVKSSVGLKVTQGLQGCKGLNTNLVLSIIRVESNYKVGAVNKASSDYGLMQVNEWHVKRKKLDKSKLLTDVSYNMQEGCKILRYFRNRYPNIAESVARYNCGTKLSCVKWDGVMNYVEKVLTFKHKLDNMDVQNK